MLENKVTFLHYDMSFTVVYSWLGLKIKKLELWPADLLWNSLDLISRLFQRKQLYDERRMKSKAIQEYWYFIRHL